MTTPTTPAQTPGLSGVCTGYTVELSPDGVTFTPHHADATMSLSSASGVGGDAPVTSRYDPAYDPAVDAAARGLLSASCLSGAQLEALQARLASEYQTIADNALWGDLPAMADERLYPHVGMIEPRIDATAALASLAEAEALAHALAATVPRRPTLLRRIVPTTATAFWMAAAFWLGFLLARAEGWL